MFAHAIAETMLYNTKSPESISNPDAGLKIYRESGMETREYLACDGQDRCIAQGRKVRVKAFGIWKVG
jgi:hypothetical protein